MPETYSYKHLGIGTHILGIDGIGTPSLPRPLRQHSALSAFYHTSLSFRLPAARSSPSDTSVPIRLWLLVTRSSRGYRLIGLIYRRPSPRPYPKDGFWWAQSTIDPCMGSWLQPLRIRSLFLSLPVLSALCRASPIGRSGTDYILRDSHSATQHFRFTLDLLPQLRPSIGPFFLLNGDRQVMYGASFLGFFFEYSEPVCHVHAGGPEFPAFSVHSMEGLIVPKTVSKFAFGTTTLCLSRRQFLRGPRGKEEEEKRKEKLPGEDGSGSRRKDEWLIYIREVAIC